MREFPTGAKGRSVLAVLAAGLAGTLAAQQGGINCDIDDPSQPVSLAVQVGSAQAPPMQAEFQVNTLNDNVDTSYPTVAMNRKGRFVVAWESYDADQGPVNLTAMARPFDASGAPASGEFQVSTPPAGILQSDVRAAVDGSGSFVVAWLDHDYGTLENSIWSRRFGPDGTPLGPKAQVNVGGHPQGGVPGIGTFVASDPSGAYVVVWQDFEGMDYHVMARVFDSAGLPLSGNILVDTYTSPGADDATPGGVAKTATGFVVSFVGRIGAGGGNLFRLFDPVGNPTSPVTDTHISADGLGAVSAARDGGFVIVVGDDVGVLLKPVMGRLFNSAGAPLGGEFTVDASGTDPEVAMDSSGNFMVQWDGLGDAFARRYDRFGDPTDSGGFVFNSYTTGDQSDSSVGLANDGSFLVTWVELDSYPTTVASARLSGVAAAPATVDSSGNGVLEPGESVDVRTAWSNRMGSALAMSGTATDFSGPAGATYTLDDSTASYGNVAPGATGSCSSTGNCYGVTVSDPAARPAQHWDTLLQELHSTNAPKTWSLHVGESFPDVQSASPFYKFIETLFHNEVTGGCAGGNYCPTSPVTRAQMAVFLLKSKLGSAHVPPPCTGSVFMDVPCTGGIFDPWIEELAGLGITGGCGGGLYCPTTAVTRKQMAAFLLKAHDGASYDPPDCTGIFADVPCTPGTGFSDWIEELYARQITGGCSASPLGYCPDNPNTRGQMAVFLTKTFGLELYGAD